MMTMFDWMLDGGTHSRLDVMNSKLDALIEGQKGIVTVLNEGFKETNRHPARDTQKDRDTVPQRRSACVTPGLADGLRDPSFVLCDPAPRLRTFAGSGSPAIGPSGSIMSPPLGGLADPGSPVVGVVASRSDVVP